MSEFRLSPEAEDQLDAIWLHIARESAASTSPAASLTV
jgi:plasmid stabilization system protein ParE